jgi:hypothetical protein
MQREAANTTLLEEHRGEVAVVHQSEGRDLMNTCRATIELRHSASLTVPFGRVRGSFAQGNRDSAQVQQ